MLPRTLIKQDSILSGINTSKCMNISDSKLETVVDVEIKVHKFTSVIDSILDWID